MANVKVDCPKCGKVARKLGRGDESEGGTWRSFSIYFCDACKNDFEVPLEADPETVEKELQAPKERGVKIRKR